MAGKSDYAFLKTGTGEGAAAPATMNMLRQTMSLCVALTGRAAVSATTYAQHAGRRVHPEDIAMAMQYQSKVFFDEVTDDEVKEARAEVDAAMDDGETTSDDDSDDEGTSEEDDEGTSEEDTTADDSDEEPGPWTKSTCACAVCVGTNEARETWDSWNPDDEALAYLKRATDKYLASRINM